MEVHYAGRFPSDWHPGPGSLDGAGSATDYEMLEQDFLLYVEGQLRQWSNWEMPAHRAANRLSGVVLRSVLLDPSSHLLDLQRPGPGQTQERVWQLLYVSLADQIRTTTEHWNARQPGEQGRSAAARQAQAAVPQWYGKKCVLTGEGSAQGAHIVPVRVTRDTELPAAIWNALRFVWPMSTRQEVSAQVLETTNILPLSPSAHSKWDRFEFALRPIAHPTDPHRRMYLQVLWLARVDTPGGLVAMDDGPGTDADGCPRMTDVRRHQARMCPAIEHGDVYELVSSDPDVIPLPSFRMCQVQLAVHKLQAGMRAAGALHTIFEGGPPDDEGPVPRPVEIPLLWAELLDVAVDKGVLDAASAALWERAFQWREFRFQELCGYPPPSQHEDNTDAADSGERV